MVGAPTEDACPAIDGFEVLRRIGEGNAGDVFEAIRLGPEGFRKPVAIKRLAVGRTRDRKALDRFLREARISARLDHPNIVRVEELLITEEGHFLVMELLRGRTLLELCRHLPTAPMPRELALAVASQALDGLAHAHALSDEQGRPLGLVHRDLTPRNLFVRTSGVVKILDFGIAKLRLAMNTGLTGEGRVLGTLDFLSPEQARGEEVDARSDLYQVGAVLYYLLSGKTPHGALATEELVERAARECPPPLDVLRPELPARVVALVARALELEPESRFPDAEAMRGAIEDAREDGAAMGPREIERLMAGLSVASESQTETIGEAVAARPELKPDVRTGRDPLVGRTLGGFVLREKIGQGGFGVVYRAEQPALHREAVVKVLLARDAGEQAIERFFREAHLASSLDHPYAAHIYELGAEPDGVLWIAMELVRGTPLSTFLEVQGALSPERFAPLLVRICEVVEAAHERGIVHRDLKPANVMVIVRSGRILPKLLDFGISKLVESAPPGDVGASGPEPGGVVEEPSLTQRGLLIGSPPYMAPEQWRDPHAADARADLYALGVLAYEAISGHRPFDGDRMELRRKHLSEPPPPLGPNFPPELDAVLKRALAKRPEDRYESALELAAAFRAAVGPIGDGFAGWARLDERLVGEWLTRAPQPLAEAVAALDTAGSAFQARDALWQLLRVAARYLGLVALACRARVGAGGSNAEIVLDALRRLRRHGLSDLEWLELTRELTRSFALRPDAYPVPELVALFFLPASEEPSPGAALDRLLALRTSAPPAGSEQQVMAVLSRAVTDLGMVLHGLSFLFDYALVVPVGGRAERWMGRAPYATVPVTGRPLVDGRPALIDRGGCPLVVLWPFVQVVAPSQGAPDAVFLLEGSGRHGAKLVALPFDFERHDETMWDSASWAVPAEDGQDTTEDERAPYLGLMSFTAGDVADFLGREREVEDFVNRLRVQPLLALVGPSGAGKSSFVQAGVIPSLPPGWRPLTVRPGSSPLVALRAGLERAGIAPGDLGAQPGWLGAALRGRAPAEPLVLVVDQFEELFTMCTDAEERQRYAEELTGAARTADDPVRVVFVLRDDFLARAQHLAPLRDRLTLSLQLLGTPAPADLQRILVQPARRAGYKFDDAELPGEMAREVADRPGALALLSFTAARLWDLRDRQFSQLTRKAYASLGGVVGALAQHAEATLGRMTHEEQRRVREAFRHLVTAEGTRAVLTRSEVLQVLGGGSPAEAVAEKLVAARLVVACEGETGDDRVEIVHEALLGAWPRLVQWRLQDAEGARLRDQLHAAARQWTERGRPGGLLWRDEALQEYRIWRSRFGAALTDQEAAFAQASLAAAARGRRARLAVLGVAFLVLCTGVVVFQQMHARARARLARLFEEQGRQSLLAGDPMRSLVFLSEAIREGARSPGLGFMVTRARRQLGDQLAVLPTGGPVYTAVFSPDGKRVVTGGYDRIGRIWDAATGRLLSTLEGHQDMIAADISPDGAWTVTMSSDATVKLWDTDSGDLRHTLQHDGPVSSVNFSPDSRHLVSTSQEAVTVWDVATGAALRRLEGHRLAVYVAGFSPDGTRIVTGSADKTARIWDAETGRLQASLEGHRDYVGLVGFSPDGRLVATATFDGTVKLWEATTGALRFTFDPYAREAQLVPGAAGNAAVAAFSPDSERIVTAVDDVTAHVWDTRTGELLYKLVGHTGFIAVAAFSPQGDRIVTVGSDTGVKAWNARGGQLLHSWVGHQERVVSVAFDAAGQRIVTASWDGTARVWDAQRTDFLISLEGHVESVHDAAFSKDGRRIVTASTDDTVALWDAASGLRIAALLAARLPPTGDEMIRRVAVFSPDGSRIATNDEYQAKIWDVATQRLLLTLEGHSGPVRSVAFSPDGTRLVTASNDHTARVWDAGTGGLLTTMLLSDAGYQAEFSPDGERVVTAAINRVQVWSVRGGPPLAQTEGHDLGILGARFSPDGARVVSAGQDKTAKIWSATTGKLLASLEGHGAEVIGAHFSPDGALVATCSFDGTARVWEAATGKQLYVFESQGGAVYAVHFAPDGRRLLTAHADGTAKLWDVEIESVVAGELADFVRCHVPYRLDGERLMSAEPDRERCPPPRPGP